MYFFVMTLIVFLYNLLILVLILFFVADLIFSQFNMELVLRMFRLNVLNLLFLTLPIPIFLIICCTIILLSLMILLVWMMILTLALPPFFHLFLHELFLCLPLSYSRLLWSLLQFHLLL